MIAVDIGNEDPVGLRILAEVRHRIRIDMDDLSAKLEHHRAMNDRRYLQIAFRCLLRRHLRRQEQE